MPLLAIVLIENLCVYWSGPRVEVLQMFTGSASIIPGLTAQFLDHLIVLLLFYQSPSPFKIILFGGTWVA